MKKLRTFGRATGSFFKELFRPSLPLDKLSENGHPILKGWESCPEEDLFVDANESRESRRHAKKAALFCTDGPHQGELFLLGNNMETIGPEVENSFVLTPSEECEPTKFQMQINGVSTLMAETGKYFRLNGVEEQKAALYDFDEIELLGNRFLVMDLNIHRGQPNENT